MELHGTMKINDRGVLEIGGIDTGELIADYGTPLLVIDEAGLRENIRHYTDAFARNYNNYRVLYAAKAFYNRTLFRIMQEEDAGIDVVSGGELYTALEANFPPEDIFFHGNNKQTAEIQMALENGVGCFVVDNSYEVELLEDMAKEKEVLVDVLLRLTPGIEAHTHEFIQTGQIDSKFGVGLAGGDAMKLVKDIIDREHLQLQGLHAHIGSQIFEIDPYRRLVEVMFSFMKEIRNETGLILRELDLGGGVGISYVSEDDPPVIEDFIREICDRVRLEAEKIDYPLPEIIVEPGRSVVGTAGTTLYTAGSIKQVPGMSKYIAVDGGMTDNIRPALYDAVYDAFVANKGNKEATQVVTIAGKCCESGDILVKDAELPAVEPGDIIAITATGAYTYPMASNYNGIPRPAVILVNDGQAEVIIARESYADMIKNDLIPEGY
ncbi:MAG: diaminopimelate decarboxylase [Halanaerobiaceae bacterium]